MCFGSKRSSPPPPPPPPPAPPPRPRKANPNANAGYAERRKAISRANTRVSRRRVRKDLGGVNTSSGLFIS